jgi:threonine dehydratase
MGQGSQSKFMSRRNYRVTLDNVVKAVPLIDPVFLNTPQYVNDRLSQLLGMVLITKVETLNPIRCFKGRGADLLVKKTKPGTHLVCASAGNFGQAMAYSCKKKGLQLTVFAGTKANPFKIERMRSLGAEVILTGDDFDSAKFAAKQKAKEMRARFVEDGLDIETLEGAAIIGLELLKFPQKIDVVLIPVGNGALFNGIARLLKLLSPSIRMVAIQAKGAPAMIESWKASRFISYDSVNTIADGIAVRVPVQQALEDMKGLVDDALLVDDKAIVKGMKVIHEYVGVVSEPSGAVGVAAILENPKLFQGQTVVTILCGGNITAEQQEKWL